MRAMNERNEDCNEGSVTRRPDGSLGSANRSPETMSNPIFDFFNQSGCLSNIRAVHKSYMDGVLDLDQCRAVNLHTKVCRYCRNMFDALTSEMEESFPCRVRESDDDDAEDGFAKRPVVVGGSVEQKINGNTRRKAATTRLSLV